MKATLHLFLASLCLSLFLSAVHAADTTAPKPKHVDVTGATQLLETNKSVIILDIRTEEEFKDGHIPKAVNIDYLDRTFGEKLDKLDKSKPYLVHCAAGGRSTKSLEQFKAKGFTNIYHLDGGLNAWQSSQKPVTK
ncbi:MAG TPA: rhodanese-like domain-containing protein [Verrucomicrobiae bacterium]